MGTRLLALFAIISGLVLLVYQTGVTVAQEGDGQVGASFSVIEPLVVVETTTTASQPELNTLETVIEPLAVADLLLTSVPVEITSGVAPGSPLRVALPLSGASEGPINGDINFTLGGLEVETLAGETTATFQIDPVLKVVGTASLAGTPSGGIDLNLSDPKLVFQPPDPDVSLLSGGDPAVTDIGANFAIDLNNLPDGAALVGIAQIKLIPPTM